MVKYSLGRISVIYLSHTEPPPNLDLKDSACLIGSFPQQVGIDSVIKPEPLGHTPLERMSSINCEWWWADVRTT